MTPERLTELERMFPKNPIVQELVSAVRDAQGLSRDLEAQITLLHAGKGVLPEQWRVDLDNANKRAFGHDRRGDTIYAPAATDEDLDAANAHASGSCDPETCPIVAPHHDGNGSVP